MTSHAPSMKLTAAAKVLQTERRPGARRCAALGDAGYEVDLVVHRVEDVREDEGAGRCLVVAESAAQRVAGAQPAGKRKRQRAPGTYQGAVRQELRPVPYQAPLGGHPRPVQAPDSDVGLTWIPRVRGKLEGHRSGV
jgi:hypothetical protein